MTSGTVRVLALCLYRVHSTRIHSLLAHTFDVEDVGTDE